jgi:hypothetical protein
LVSRRCSNTQVLCTTHNLLMLSNLLHGGKRVPTTFVAGHRQYLVTTFSQQHSTSQRQTSFAFRTMASSSFVPEWATADPLAMGTTPELHAVCNLVGGKWTKAKSTMTIPHPMDRDAHPIFTLPDTQSDELAPFFASLRSVPKSGMHNPLKNPERYVQYGEISRKVCFLILKIKRKLSPRLQVVLSTVSLTQFAFLYFLLISFQLYLGWSFP